MRTRQEIEQLEEQTLAPYAMKSRNSAGREHDEPQHDNRTCYQRDRDRVVHSEAFRKLEYKTQVFSIFEADYYRTRLTHTLEVAQIGRTIGRNLRLNEDLIEAIALAHDLGHPPFGHAGEEALNEKMKQWGGFNHNQRSFEIVTKYEKRYPDFDGLNLTREVRVGILKHHSVYDQVSELAEYQNEWPTLEAQVVDFADSLAYLNHDIDDGIKSGCLAFSDLQESELWQMATENFSGKLCPDNSEMFRYQVVKELIDRQIKDLLMTTDARLAQLNPPDAIAVQASRQTLVGFSSQMNTQREMLQKLLFNKLYRHFRVVRMTSKARRIVHDLFEIYLKEPDQLPYAVYPRDRDHSLEEQHAIICNYIASMTDRFALEEHKKFFNPYAKV
jgi:dGTPase